MYFQLICEYIQQTISILPEEALMSCHMLHWQDLVLVECRVVELLPGWTRVGLVTGERGLAGHNEAKGFKVAENLGGKISCFKLFEDFIRMKL